MNHIPAAQEPHQSRRAFCDGSPDLLPTLVAQLSQQRRLLRHIAMCRLSVGGQYQRLDPEQLGELAERLRAMECLPVEVVDLIRTLAELRSIELIGATESAKSEEPAWQSPTAALFGYPAETLTTAAMVLLRRHHTARLSDY